MRWKIEESKKHNRTLKLSGLLNHTEPAGCLGWVIVLPDNMPWSGLWTVFGLNWTVFAIHILTTGSLPSPVANTNWTLWSSETVVYIQPIIDITSQ